MTNYRKACTQKDPPNPAAFTPDEKACLQSLHFTEMHSRKNDVTDPAPSTCTWLLKHPKYREWLGQGHGMLWIKGKPGAGKSTLLKHALETAERESKVGITLVSFFFHGRGAPMQKTVLGLFRSLLHQILQKNRDLLSKLTSLYKRSSETEGEFGRKWNWHEKQLQNFFKQNVVDAARTHPIRIYIDALDECGEDVATELVEFLRCLAAPISICFSCRHYPFVALEGGNEVCVEHENEQDIESYINDKINTHVQRVDIAQVIRDEMVSRSNSNFQWVVLVLPRVLRLHKSRKSLAAIQTVIRNIPAELSELYTTLLDFVDEDERVQSLRLLQWISFAFRPLTLSELRCALAVGLEMNYKSLRECQVSGLYVDTDEDMERIVCDRSKGLAEVSNWPGVRIVQFVHQSVKDFLLEQGFQSLDYASAGTVVGRGHFRLSRSCFKYFLMEEVQDFATSTPSTSRSTEATATSQKRIRLENDCPMLSYSVEYLFRHVQEVDVANMSQNDLVALSYKRIDGTLLQSWFAVFAVFKDDFIGGTLLHAASAYNLISVVKVILARNVWADPKDKSGDTPLSRAAANGHNVVVDMLMNRDDVDVNSKNKRCRTPLSMASKCGHEAMVMMLLNRPDVDVNTKDEDGGTPLSLAVERGNEAIVEILLNRDDVDVNSRDKNSDTPLFIASTGMQETMVKILLNRDDVDVNSKNRYGDTPFSGAARSGYVSITKLFLERGVHLSQTHGQLTTALSEAAGKGQSGLMELLLQCNAKIDSTNDKGRTPLSYAAPQGCYEIVKLLLQYNANVNSRDYQGRTPFSYAVSWGGCYEIVKLLLQYNANIDSRDNRGRTPLSYAASQGCFNIVKLLLPYNVNVNARDNLERTPLSYAALYGCCMTVNLLLQRTVLQDVDIDVRDIYGRTPLSYAACRGHIAVVKLLLEGSSNADQKAEDGRTPFSYAAGNGYMKVLELMVERGNVDINSKDSHGRSPLSWALLFQGYWIVDVVEYLLKQNDVIVTEEDRDLMKKRFRYGGVDVGLTEEEVWSEEGSEEESEKEQSEEEQNDEESEEAGSEVDQNSRATKRVRSQSDLEQPRKQTPMSIDTLLN